MRLSYRWIMELLFGGSAEAGAGGLPSPTEIGEILTKAGAELEGIEYPAKRISRLVAVKIMDIKADTPRRGLSLCEVFDGEQRYSTITGAPDAEIGLVVPYAPPGAILASGKTIEAASIDGATSTGMLLSGAEVGIEEPKNRLLHLPDDTPLGTDIADVLGWVDEAILDLEITPNRSDLLGHIGLAREIAAVMKRDFVSPRTEIPITLDDNFPIIIDIPKLCPRYTGRIVRNVSVAPSPLVLQGRLAALGVRPINNIVDATNYVMLLTAHPMHAFDLSLLHGGKIVVRTAEKGEHFTTLDGDEHTLEAGDILITDGSEPVAIGGVMGGLNSEVRPDTKNILLEAAYFDPPSIRRTSRRLGLISESSYRFERGVDPNGTIPAIEWASKFIADTSPAMRLSPIFDAYPKPYEPRIVELPYRKVFSLLGLEIPKRDGIGILERLGFDVRNAGETLVATAPTSRPDIKRDVDLVEEIGRIYGYDAIEPALVNKGPLQPAFSKREELKRTLYARLRDIGIMPIVGNPFGQRKRYKPFLPQNVEIAMLKNPLSEELSALRPSLIPSLLETVSLNRNREMRGISAAFFEIDHTYYKNDDSGYVEPLKLAVALTGNRTEKSWDNNSPNPYDIFDIKGLVEMIAALFRVPIEIKRDKILWSKDDFGAAMYLDKDRIGAIGKVRKDVLHLFEIKESVYALELSLEPAIEIWQPVGSFAGWSDKPSVYRDVALIVDDVVLFGNVIDYISSIKEPLLVDVHLFDRYKGKPIPAGKKSLGLSFTYRSSEKTLTDEEIDMVHTGIVKALLEKFDASLREM